MGNSFRQTIASIFSHSKMTAEKMLESHRASSIERGKTSEGEYLIVAQDTTYYTYSGHEQMQGLGYIQGGVRGIM